MNIDVEEIIEKRSEKLAQTMCGCTITCAECFKLFEDKFGKCNREERCLAFKYAKNLLKSKQFVILTEEEYLQVENNMITASIDAADISAKCILKDLINCKQEDRDVLLKKLCELNSVEVE